MKKIIINLFLGILRILILKVSNFLFFFNYSWVVMQKQKKKFFLKIAYFQKERALTKRSQLGMFI